MISSVKPFPIAIKSGFKFFIRSFSSFFNKAMKNKNQVLFGDNIENSEIMFTKNSNFPEGGASEFFYLGKMGSEAIFFNILKNS